MHNKPRLLLGEAPAAAGDEGTPSAPMFEPKKMEYKYNKKLLGNASYMRSNMTPEERHLWYDFLKRLPVNVNRQKVIGNYIVDFYIHSHKIVIEVDGVQHKTKIKQDDQIRDAELGALGITVLRYSNIAVNQHFNYVCNDILKHMGLGLDDLKCIKPHFELKQIKNDDE